MCDDFTEEAWLRGDYECGPVDDRQPPGPEISGNDIADEIECEELMTSDDKERTVDRKICESAGETLLDRVNNREFVSRAITRFPALMMEIDRKDRAIDGLRILCTRITRAKTHEQREELLGHALRIASAVGHGPQILREYTEGDRSVILTKDKMPPPNHPVIIQGGPARWTGKHWVSDVGDDQDRIIEWPVTWWKQVGELKEEQNEHRDNAASSR